MIFRKREDNDSIDITETVEEDEYYTNEEPPFEEEPLPEEEIEEGENTLTESEYEPSPIDPVGVSDEQPRVPRRVMGRVPPQLRVRTHVEMQPIATGKQLLTGKGLPSIEFNLGGITKVIKKKKIKSIV